MAEIGLLDAVELVLDDVGTPLTQSDLSQRILGQNLWSTSGKTPEATIGARIYVDMKQRGSASRFQLADKGLFALRAWGLPEYHSQKKQTIPPKNQPRALKCETAKALSFTDSAEKVLAQSGDKKPMHYREITQRALELGFLHSEGNTPEATLYSQILSEITRKTRRGETPRFVRHGKGYFGLTKWMGTGLVFQIEQHNAGIRKKPRSSLRNLSAAEFEKLVGELLGALGFERASVTRLSGDGGIYVRGVLVIGDVIRIRMAVQAKNWQKNVQAPDIQQVRGSLGAHEQGLIITTSDFSSGAMAEAERPNAVPVALMNGEKFVALLVEHSLGVRRNSYDLLELGEPEEK